MPCIIPAAVTSSLTFTYTVQEGDLDLLGMAVGTMIDLNGGSIKNGSTDAPLTFTAPDTSAVFVDGVLPVVSSINRLTPSADTTAASSVIFQVTFSKPVTDVNWYDFYLTLSGSANGGIDGFIPESDSVYDVIIDGVTGMGTLRLNLNTITGIADIAGNPLIGGYASGQSYALLPLPQITSDFLTSGTYKQPFTYNIVADNFPTTYAASGLPPGLTVDSSSGVISGAPSQAGVFSPTITVSNASGSTDMPLNLTIAQAPLTVTGITANDKVYDHSRGESINTGLAALNGAASGDDVGLDTTSAVGLFADSTVGTDKPVSVFGLSLSGVTAPNYILVNPMANASITPLGISVVGVTANDKIYDGGNTATLIGHPALSGAFPGDEMGLVTKGATGTFADKLVGSAKPVTITGFIITGFTASNYTLTQPTASAGITSRPLTVSGVTADNKVYDAGTAATIHTAGAALVSTVLTDNINLVTTGAIGTFADATAATTKPVTVSGLALGGTDAANYTLTQPVASADISQATATVTLAGLSQTYDGTPKVVTATTSPSGLTVNFTYNGLSSAPVIAGTYTVIGTISDPNYMGSATGTLSVAKVPLTITAANLSKTYGDPNPTFVFNYSGFVTGDSASSLTIPPTATTAATQGSWIGNFSITPSGAASPNYDFTYVNGSLSVTKATLTVLASNTNRPYGAANPAFTVVVTGVKNSDNITGVGATTATNTSPVGDYGITVGTRDPAGRLGAYQVTLKAATLTVDPAVLTGQVVSMTSTYGSPTPSFSVSYTGFANNETISLLSGTLTYQCLDSNNVPVDANTSVGTYPISVLTQQTATNYTVQYLNGNLTVNPAPLTVTGISTTRVYGQPNPEFGATFDGFVNSQDASFLGGSLSVTSSAVASSSVGNYSIVPSGLTSTNYAIVFHDGNLSVTPAPLSVTIANQSRAYGAPDPSFTGSLSGVLGTDVITATYIPLATAASPVATYPIVPTFSDAGNRLGNYTIATNGGSLTINPALLTGNVVSMQRAYGATNPVFAISYTGFANEQTSDVVSGTPLFTCLESNGSLVTSNSDVNAYSIHVTGGPSAPNYDIHFNDGTLLVTQVVLTVTADNTSRVYGVDNPAFTATVQGFVNGQDTNALQGTLEFATTATADSHTGGYPITPSNFTSDNYLIKFVDGTLTVGKATILVTADDQTRTYGANNPSLTASYSGFVDGDTAGVVTGTPGLTTTADNHSNVAGYPITATQGSLSAADYAFSFKSGTLTVTPALLTVTADNQGRNYADLNPDFTGTLSGVQNSENLTATFTTLATSSDPVGDYGIFPQFNDPSKLANYTVTTNLGKLTVEKVPLTVSANNHTKVYGQVNPTLDGDIVGVVNGDNLTATYIPWPRFTAQWIRMTSFRRFRTRIISWATISCPPCLEP